MAAPSTVQVFNLLRDSTGAGIANATIHCVLDYSQATVAATGDDVLDIQQTATTDSTGKYTFTVVPNDLLNPANTTYTIVEPHRSYQIAPQSANGASQQTTAANVIVTAPATLAPNPLTVPGAMTVAGAATFQGTSDLQGVGQSDTTFTFHGPVPFADPLHPTYGAKGDGTTDDATAIQSAITAAGTNGVVRLSPGKTYLIKSGLTVSNSGVVIEGYGAILKANADSFDMLSLGTTTDCVIRGVTFYGAATAENFTKAAITAGAGSRHRIVDCTFSGPNATTSPIYGVSFNSTTDCLIEGCQFLNFVGTQTSIGIYLQNAAHRNRIIGNEFNFTTSAGRFMIAARNPANGATACSENLVMGNTFIGGSGGSGASGGDQVSFDNFANTNAMVGNQIIGNKFRDYNGASTEALEAAIEIAGNIQDTQIANNEITNTARHGIVVEEDGSTSSCQTTQIVGNKIFKNKRHGILIRGTVSTLIQSNEVRANSQESVGTYNGIMLSTDSSTACQNARVLNNYCYDTANQKAGIFLDSATPVPTNTVIIGNVVPQNNTNSIVDNGTTTRLIGNSDTTANSGVGRAVPGQPWDVNGNLVHTTAYKARAYLSANQLLTSGTWTTGNIDTKVYDPNTNFNTTTHLYTVPVTGYYMLSAAHQNAASAGRVGLRFNKNAGTNLANLLQATNAANTSATLSDIQLLTAGDTISLDLWQDAGTSQNALSGTQNTYLSIHYLSS